MNTRAKTTRRAKDAASSFMKKVVSGRNVHSPTPEKDLPDTKTARQKQVNNVSVNPTILFDSFLRIDNRHVHNNSKYEL